MTMTTRSIWCIACNKDVQARLTSGEEIYPHRLDLVEKRIWICDFCKNYVSCHDKSLRDPLAPTGCIPTAAVRAVRRSLHALIDPIWNNGYATRNEVYAFLSQRLGYTFHGGEIKSVEEANAILPFICELQKKFL